MPTSLNFRDIVNLPDWRILSPAPANASRGYSLINDLRNNIDRHPWIYELASASTLYGYHKKNDEWTTIAATLSLAGSFGDGACGTYMPSLGHRGALGVGCTASSLVILTAFPVAVPLNCLANRGDGQGYKIRVIGNGAGSSGKIEERYIIANTFGTTPTIVLNTPLTFTPVNGDTFEVLSGRVYLLNAGTVAAGIWKYYDPAINYPSGNLATTNLPATIGMDSAIMPLDELYVPYDRAPGEGFLGVLTATAAAAGTLTGQTSGGDSVIANNEYRNFQIRIVEDTAKPTAVGQRRLISSHALSGGAQVYTLQSNWTVTPSATAKFVIENANWIILFTSGVATVYTYAPIGIGTLSENSWSNTQFAARGGAVGAGVMGAQSFGIEPDPGRNARHSFVNSFRGGGSTVLEILDIAAAANGAWIGGVSFIQSGVISFSTGSCAVYEPATNEGRYMHINQNGTQRMLRFDMKNRVLEPWAYMRYAGGTAYVGERFATGLFCDGETKLAYLYHRLHNSTYFYNIALQR